MYLSPDFTTVPENVCASDAVGMPALESVASGTPVVCARVGALPEVLGDAAEWCESGDAGTLAKALAPEITVNAVAPGPVLLPDDWDEATRQRFAATTPLGLGASELGGTGLSSSSSPRGGIAGGQVGFNWQAGMVVFGAEFDAQWSGQSNAVSLICTPPIPGCTATEAVKIRSLTTGRARIGLAFDWLMPYVTAGGVLVNARDDLTVNVGGASANFQPLSNTTLGWTAGAGVDVALSSNWSARFEYLHIRANGITSSVLIPGFLGNGTASETASYRDNIVRVGLNYRIGPRGGPGVLETRVLPGSAYALNYDFLPSVAAIPSDKVKSVTRPPDGTVVAEAVPQVAPQPPQVAQQVPQQAAPIASEPKTSKRPAKNFLEIGDVDDLDALSAQPEPPKLPSKKRREKEEDESQRLKRIMAICAGC